MSASGLLVLLIAATTVKCGPLERLSSHLSSMSKETRAACKVYDSCILNDPGYHVIGIDSEKYVERGTTCTDKVTNGYYICQDSGLWVPIAVRHPEGSLAHNRIRRSWLSLFTIGAKILCAFICRKSDSGAKYVPNTPPVVDCPYLPLQKPSAGTSTTVTWKEPVGSDKEDGSLTPKRTGPPPGSVFQQGYNQVSYRVTDKGGLSDKCTVAIQVAAYKCPRLPYLRHGRLHCTNGEISGSSCTVTCDEGYTIDGSQSITCQKESWSQALPVCKAASCGSYPVMDNGYVTPLGPPQYNTYCTLSCKTGYALEGLRMTVCQATGQWTPTGSCRDTAPPSFTNGCPDDIELFASMRNAPTQATWTYTGVKDNSGLEVKVTSNPPSGSEFPNGKSRVTATATDKDGNEATCRFNVIVNSLTCPEPVLKDDKLRYKCPDGYGYGFNCSVYCHSNYPMIGSDVIVCLKEDSVFPPKAAWSWPPDSEPKCVINKCPKLRTPKNGAIVQDGWNNGPMSVMMCNTKYDIPRKVPELYACGEQTGLWRPSDTVYDCSRTRRAGQMILPSELYYYSGTCGTKETNLEIQNKFITILNTSKTFTDLCGVTVKECRSENVVIMCGATRRKRGADFLHAVVKRAAGVIFTFDIVTPFEQRDGEDFKTARARVEAELTTTIGAALDDMVTKGEFNMADYDFKTEADAFRPGVADFKCDGPGLKPSYDTGTCRGCPDGTHVDGDDCPDCPVGTYTEPDSPNTCKPCDAGKSTLSARSTSADECIALCSLGTYSPTGMVPCMPCAAGHYQDQTGSKSCKLCSPTTTTREEATQPGSGCMGFDLKFDGNNDRKFGSVNANMSSVTLSFWMKINPSGNGVVSMSGLQGNMAIKMSTSSPLVLDIFGQAMTTTVSTASSKWQHLAVTVDELSKEVVVYLEGNKVFTDTATSLVNPVLVEGDSMSAVAESGTLHLRSVVLVDTVLPLDKISALASSCGSVEDNLKYSFIRSGQQLVIPSKCDNTDECASYPCGAHGTCIDKGDNFQCECANGWTGVTCITPPDYCKTHACQNNAACKNEIGNYTCTCTKGFLGNLCQEHAVNGNWGEWSGMSDCSKTCGGGTRTRTRECDDPPPDEDGDDCVGDKENTQRCNEEDCPVCPSFRLSFGNIKKCTNDGAGFVNCTLKCRDDLVFSKLPFETYECGPNNGYVWNHQESNQNARPPACTKARPSRGYDVTHSATLPSLPSATANANKEAITSQINGRLSDLDCVKESICETVVSIASPGRKKRSTLGTTLIIRVITNMPASATLDLQAFVESGTVTAGLKEYLNIAMKTDSSIQTLVNNSATLLTVTIDGTQYQVDLDTMTTTTVVMCPDGTFPTEGVCGDCPPGTREEANICVLCKKGTYQPQAASTTCRACPQGKTTLEEGSDDVSQCIKSTDSDRSNEKGPPNTDTKSGYWLPTITGAVLGATAIVILMVVLAGVIYRWKSGVPRSRSSARIEPGRPMSPPPPYPYYTAGGGVAPFTTDLPPKKDPSVFEVKEAYGPMSYTKSGPY